MGVFRSAIRSVFAPAPIATFAIGLVLGVLVAWPMGIKLPADALQLFTAIVTALIGVATALGVVEYTAFRNGRSSARYVLLSTQELWGMAIHLSSLLPSEGEIVRMIDRSSWRKILFGADGVLASIEKSLRDLKRFEEALKNLRPDALQALFLTERAISDTQQAVVEIHREAHAKQSYRDGTLMQPINLVNWKASTHMLERALRQVGAAYGISAYPPEVPTA